MDCDKNPKHMTYVINSMVQFTGNNLNANTVWVKPFWLLIIVNTYLFEISMAGGTCLLADP